MHNELSNCGDISSASLIKNADFTETVGMEGRYVAQCFDKDGNLKWEDTIDNVVTAAGKQLMLDTILAGSAFTATVVMGLVGSTGTTVTAGSFVTGATYQILVPGTTNFTLIGAANSTAGTVFVATGAGTGTGTATLIGTFLAADTQSSHAGWNEIGSTNTPTYSGTRKTPTFSAASSSGLSPSNVTTKATSAAVSFTFNGTVSGPVGGCFININGTSAIDNTTGTLYSAGAFTGGYKTVAPTDVLNVTYSTTATS
jgi:hypothetical protein